MTKTKKLGLLVFCIICFAIPMLFIGCGDANTTPTTNYTLHNYSVLATVHDNGKIDIQETFTVAYNTSSLHGVSRYIPLNMKAYYDRESGITTKNYKVEIENAEVTYGKCAEKGKNGDYYVFMLGDAYNYVSPSQRDTYSIKYTLIMPDDRLGDMDVFYYNILPFDWDTSITNASFEINFNFDITSEELYDKTVVYFGDAGTTEVLGDDAVSFEDSKISGTISYIKAFNGVTVYTEFSEGALGNKSSIYAIVGGVGIAVVILLAVAMFFYYKKKKIIRDLVPTVEFKAPEGLTPAESGLIIDGKVDNRDLVSMIIYWASRGYLQIIENDKEIHLKKTKPLDDTFKSYEKTLFNCIFKSGELVNIKDINGLGENLLVAKAQLKKDIKHLNYEPTTKNARAMINFVASLIPALILALMLYLVAMPLWYVYALIDFFALVGVTTLYDYAIDKEFYHKKGLTIFYKVLCGLLVLAIIILYMVFAFEIYADKCLLIIFAHIFAFYLTYLGGEVLSRTEVSNSRLGKIIGLKNFILVTEKDKMEMLVKDNPKSFYDILPYAYVLNVTDVYCEKFKDVKLVMPEWYLSNELTADTFTTLYFMSLLNASLNNTYSILLNATNNVIMQNLASAAGEIGRSSGSGGGRSGGGFGGGGFGGGGGRGW